MARQEQQVSFDAPCNDWSLQAKQTQDWIFVQFLCVVFNWMIGGDDTCTDVMEDFESEIDAMRCWGGPEKIRLMIAQLICANLDVDCSQPICYSQEDLDAALLFLVFLILWEMALYPNGGGT